MVSRGTVLAARMGLIIAAAIVGSPLLGRAAESCKVKLATTGELQVSAKNVASNPRWGTSLSNIGTTFPNEGTCYDGGSLKLTKCNLGGIATLAATMPPANCTVCVGDDGSSDCCAFLKGCTPGLRMRDGSFAATDPRIEAMEVPDSTTLRFNGVNVQVVDGSGDTDGITNGRGNVIVGYNEEGDTFGSHNLIVGDDHAVYGYAGVAIGYGNNVSGFGATAIGYGNTATDGGSVSGGQFNTASGTAASVSGGNAGQAQGSSSSVTGGFYNYATGSYATVSGGSYTVASGENSSISGGRNNFAYDNASSITGGRGNYIFGGADYATIAGGYGNEINDGNFATILGGYSNLIVFSATGYNTIGGGANLSVGGSGEAGEWHAGQTATFPTASLY